MVSNHSYVISPRRQTSTYDHRLKGTGYLVRSGIHKLEIGWLVVGRVTTSESQLLYVLPFGVDSICLYRYLIHVLSCRWPLGLFVRVPREDNRLLIGALMIGDTLRLQISEKGYLVDFEVVPNP